METRQIEQAYARAQEHYAALGVDTETALTALATIPISLHCWQGDDVGGFETPDAELSGGGIQATGNYPGKARTPEQLRRDLETALSLIPGTHRLNLHAIYGEFGGNPVERNEIRPEHFQGWIDWATTHKLGLDFNPTFFSHPKADDGFTLSSADASIRKFWIEHGIACRKIGEAFGKALGTPCVSNIWVPDGFKDLPADRKGPRERLKASLDAILADTIDPAYLRDSIEGKLFGIGSESYVVGSHEFYLSYALTRKILLCLDTGHFHPTEVVSDKLSAVLTFLDEALLHVSRGVRWDSDHVVTFSDELQALAKELVRGDYLSRVHIGLDFFDASINRVAAWVIGTRNMLKALLAALLEPSDMLRNFEQQRDYTSRLALLEDLKTMPLGSVWEYYCLRQDVPGDWEWMERVKRYEREVLSQRG